MSHVVKPHLFKITPLLRSSFLSSLLPPSFVSPFFFSFFLCDTAENTIKSKKLPAHKTWRKSPNTSCTDGVGPSTPGGQFSVKARAAEQANIELHLLSHAACALPCRICGTPRTLAEARHLKKWAVSNEKRPPTSPAKTTTGPPIVTNQLWVPGLLATPRNCEARTADSCCSWSGFAFSGQWANQRGVHCQLCSTKQRQQVHHDFQLPCVEEVEGAQVHVTNETFVLTLPPASRQIRAAAFSRGKPRRPSRPATEHADRWWPRMSKGRPHRQTE